MTNNTTDAPTPRRRLPCYNQIADAYVFQQTIDDRLRRIGVTQSREDNLRLAGVQWIDGVRRALRLPVRTFDTAVVYYHKFRLMHPDSEYSFSDAAGAALFAACKIEDTLKKSRDIICAAHNLKVPRQDQLSADDPIFDSPSRTLIGLERLMLEASGFDFRSRHPQTLLIKLLKHHGYSKDSRVTKLAFKVCLDLYRTFAPLKQGTAALAVACLELAVRVVGEIEREEGRERERQQEEGGEQEQESKQKPDIDANAIANADADAGAGAGARANADPPHTQVLSRLEADYRRWKISRTMITESLHDLLDLYISHRTSTSLAPLPLDIFLQVRIPLNEEMDQRKLARYAEWVDGLPRMGVPNGPGRGGETGYVNGHGRGHGHTQHGASQHGHSQHGQHGHGGPGGSRANTNTNTNPSPRDRDRDRDRDPYVNTHTHNTAHSTSPSTNSSGGIGSGSTAATGTTAATSTSTAPAPASNPPSGPASGSAPGPAGAGNGPSIRQRIGERGRDGTVRFMLEPARERMEWKVVGQFEG